MGLGGGVDSAPASAALQEALLSKDEIVTMQSLLYIDLTSVAKGGLTAHQKASCLLTINRARSCTCYAVELECKLRWVLMHRLLVCGLRFPVSDRSRQGRIRPARPSFLLTGAVIFVGTCPS